MINTELFKEVSPLSAKDCFILIERQKSNFNFPIHIHPEYELNYIENAKGAQRIVGDSIEEIEEEELVLVTNPQLEHAWRDYNNKPQNIHEITIQFHSDLLSDQILNEGGNLAASKIRNLECPSYEICLIDYGCGKFNRKIHIMEQYP